jgi:chromosome segregation ATPase
LIIQHADTQKVAFSNQQSIQQLSTKVDKLEDLLNKLNRTVNDMQIRMAQLAHQPIPPTSTHTATIIQTSG